MNISLVVVVMLFLASGLALVGAVRVRSGSWYSTPRRQVIGASLLFMALAQFARVGMVLHDGSTLTPLLIASAASALTFVVAGTIYLTSKRAEAKVA
jgi:hypothetical protein